VSLSERFRALRDRLADRFEWPTVTIARTSTVRTDADRAAGRKGSAAVVTTTARGTLGSRKVFVSEGVYRQEATARLDSPVQAGDELTIGARTLKVISVEESNPYGEATAIIYLAVVQ
jgi:hypothetical protein